MSAIDEMFEQLAYKKESQNKSLQSSKSCSFIKHIYSIDPFILTL